MYIYPSNLKAKAKLRLWELRDIGILGVGALLSILTLTQPVIAFILTLKAVSTPNALSTASDLS